MTYFKSKLVKEVQNLKRRNKTQRQMDNSKFLPGSEGPVTAGSKSSYL